MLPHFASLGYELPPHTNPLDFVIDVSTLFTLSPPPPVHLPPTDSTTLLQISSVDSRTDSAEEESSARVGHLVQAWIKQQNKDDSTSEKRLAASTSSSSSSPVEREASAAHEPPRLSDPEKGESLSSGHAVADDPPAPLLRASFLKQTFILTRRGTRNVVRNWGVCAGFLIQAIVCVRSFLASAVGEPVDHRADAPLSSSSLLLLARPQHRRRHRPRLPRAGRDPGGHPDAQDALLHAGARLLLPQHHRESSYRTCASFSSGRS